MPEFVPDQEASTPVTGQFVPDDVDIGEIRAYNPTLLERTRNFLAPLSKLIEQLSTPPPAMPQIPRLPDASQQSPVKVFGTEVPASGVVTGIANTGIDLLNASPTPVGAALLMGGAPAKIVGGLMSPVMAQHAADQFGPMVDIVRDPNATTQQKTEAVMGEGLAALGAVAPLAGLKRPYEQVTDLGTVTPDIVGAAPKQKQLALPEPTSKTGKEVAARMAMAPDAEGKLAVLKQEQKLLGDTLSKEDQRIALDAQLQLEKQIEKEKAVEDQKQKLVDIQDAKQDVLDRQQAELDKQQKLQEQLQAEQLKQAKAQDKAFAEQQKALETPPPLETKPMVLANQAAQTAKSMENQPGTMQAQLNAMTAPAPQAPAALPQPMATAPLPEPSVAKQAAITQAVQTPEVEWRYTIQKPLMPGGKGFIQIDAIAGDTNIVSSNLPDLQKAGAKLPDVPEWVPQGQYTLSEIQNLIANGEPVKGRPAEATRKASTRRQQRGAADTDVLSSAGGSAAGAGAGYFGTTKQDDETEEEFQARRLKNMMGGGIGGAGAGFAGAKLLTGGRASAANKLPVTSKVAKTLGLVQQHSPIADDVSNTALRVERIKNRFMRGTPMRKPFHRAIQETEDRIAADLDKTVSVLNDMRRKVVTTYKGPARDAVYATMDEVFKDIAKVDQLPPDLRDNAREIFRIRAENATRLSALEGLTDATKETIVENGGNYLARQYAIFDLKNEIELREYQRSLPKADVDAALDAIQEQWKPRGKSPEEKKMAADMIETVAQDPENAVAVIKSLRPWMTDNDAAKVAAWVRAGKQAGNPAVRGLYMEVINPTDVSREEAKILLNQFLDRNQFGPFTMGRKEIGGKDVTSLYSKQDIDPRLRKVLGEIKDPLSNAYQSVKNQVQLIQRDREQREIINLGEAMGIMSRDPDSLSQGMVPFVESGTGQNNSYDNWAGVNIQPVFRDEFQSLFSRPVGDADLAGGVLLDTLKTATGLFKWMKIIPTTDSRSVNAIGAWGNNLINGRAINPTGKGYRDGFRTIMLGNGLMNPDNSLNTPRILDLRKTLIEQGIMDESALGRDFMENLQNGLTGKALAKIDEFIQNDISNPAARKGALAARFVLSGREFAAGDDVARVAGFLSEKADYQKAFPNLPEADINDMAGRAMRSTGVIYSEVPDALRKLSAYNILQPFINFPYAWSRSIANTARLGYSEFTEGTSTGNDVLAKKGSKRLMALAAMLAASSGYGLAYWFNHKNGITDEKEAAARRLGPSYIQNSPLVFDGPIKDGRATFVEESYLLPPAMFMGAIDQGIKTAQKEGGWAGLGRGAEVLAEPYLGGSDGSVLGFGPVLSTLEEIRNNKNDFGEKIYNPTDPDKDKVIAAYVLKKFGPAGASKFERIRKALSEKERVGTSGQVFSLEEELLRTLGKRATTIDVKVILPRLASDLYETYKEAGKLYSESLRNRLISEEDKLAAYQKMVEVQGDAFNDIVQLRDDARQFDLSDTKIRQGLILGGVPNTLAQQVMHAHFKPKTQRAIDKKNQTRQSKRDRYIGLPSAQPQESAPATGQFVPDN